MQRRGFLGTVLGAFGLSGFNPSAAMPAGVAGFTRARPGTQAWPGEADWAALGREVGGRLQRVSVPAFDAATSPALLSNPFYLGDQPGLTQISGVLDGWRSAPSAYAVKAESAADVAAAIRFAGAHRLRLAVKGGGHSYLGGSNAPDSLLVWTRAMDAISLHDGFVPQDSAASPVPAVSVGAGCLWLHVYDAVTTKGGRYVQGGGCTTVGVAGHVQGGGFGNFSKAFGLAAASLLEAEIVTADGAARVVNETLEPDLFWALKGGGGGTFGVVTRLTLRTHELPQTIGAVRWTIQAHSDAAFRALLAGFIAHYRTELFNPHWGEQVHATRDNRFVVEMVFQGLDEAAARQAWQPMVEFVQAHAQDYTTRQPLLVLALPARHFWDAEFLGKAVPSAISVDRRNGAQARDYWWSGDGEQAGAMFHGYHSLWLPAALLDGAAGEGKAGGGKAGGGKAGGGKAEVLVDAWFDATRHWSVAFHFNKGLAGGAAAAIEASRATATNPDVLEAFALAIIAGEGPSDYPGLPAPDLAEARGNAGRIRASMDALRRAAPNGGSYLSECDYFEENWRQASWGAHWQRLARIKQVWDPDGLLSVHHGVGSEAWTADGFTRLAG